MQFPCGIKGNQCKWEANILRRWCCLSVWLDKALLFLLLYFFHYTAPMWYMSFSHFSCTCVEVQRHFFSFLFRNQRYLLSEKTFWKIRNERNVPTLFYAYKSKSITANSNMVYRYLVFLLEKEKHFDGKSICIFF